MKYVVLKADGSAAILQRAAALKLNELQALVGGNIEAVRLQNAPALTAMVNEEGLRLDLAENPHCPGIVGDIVLGKLVPGRNETRDFVGLSKKEVKELQDAWPHLN